MGTVKKIRSATQWLTNKLAYKLQLGFSCAYDIYCRELLKNGLVPCEFKEFANDIYHNMDLKEKCPKIVIQEDGYILGKVK